MITARVSSGSFCDCFGGLGTVGSHFKSLGYEVHTGDVLRFAHYFQFARVQRQTDLKLEKVRQRLNKRNTAEILEHLNSCRTRQIDWFVKEYAIQRRFFTVDNARRIGGIWKVISRWNSLKLLSKGESAVLTASLINSADKVANTAGTYYAYLKNWTRKSLRQFKFEFIPTTKGSRKCECLQVPAIELVSDREYDILYLDPPYNERSYAHYYHLPETLALGAPCETSGLSGIPKRLITRSDFNKPNLAANSLANIVKAARFKLLAFHYSDAGLIDPEKIRSILSCRGNIEEYELTSKGYTTAKIQRNIHHRLYLVRNG